MVLHLIPLRKKNAKNFWSNEETESRNKKVFAKNKEAVVIYGFILLYVPAELYDGMIIVTNATPTDIRN